MLLWHIGPNLLVHKFSPLAGNTDRLQKPVINFGRRLPPACYYPAVSAFVCVCANSMIAILCGGYAFLRLPPLTLSISILC